MKRVGQVFAIILIALLLVACGEEVKVIEKDGFAILDIENKENQTTIVAQITSHDLTRGGIVAVNLYDEKDIVFLETTQVIGLSVGNVVLITFEDYTVVDIKKNRMKIGNHVKGQKVSNELSNEGAWK